MLIFLQPFIEDLLQNLESETTSTVLNFGHSDTIQVTSIFSINLTMKELEHELEERIPLVG